ncbi:endoglucanase 24-like [Cynara cardunculus var. scolymus]|uniref:endoglucanase 24-like n=1 Tax=Cynara cardunculus var. scolymus TaxID=59895 RepID=UPI000D62D4B8|nr:endoglucanase 24-like [Cynara cardunculus var. scolymus]
MNPLLLLLLPFWLLILQFVVCNSIYLNYTEALSKSILFFEGQRSGYIPSNQRITWRGNSALGDGPGFFSDLRGGYYNGGDNVKSTYTMAFTTTMLAWSVIEFGEMMPKEELRNTLVAIRWSADYLYKTSAEVLRIVVQVGDPVNDHNCWERPEDMDMNRTVYKLQAIDPASEVAGEVAAALAATSIAFRSFDPYYSDSLLKAASGAFDYADLYHGSYSETVLIKYGVCPYYCAFDGYQDELIWGAAWLSKASKDERYMEYIQKNGDTLAANENINEFGWDKKHAGINVLLSKEVLERKAYGLDSYKTSADNFICTLIPESSSSSHIAYTPGGLIYREGEKNLQHSTSITFLLLVYAKYLKQSSGSINCGSVRVGPAKLRVMAKRQVDYILGKNPKGMSYMVGYGRKYPQRIHHRGSFIPSIKDHPQVIKCKEGSIYFNSSNPNPNILIGAVVGGPQKDDEYEDDRTDISKSEPTTYINAPFVGALAFFAAKPIHHN